MSDGPRDYDREYTEALSDVTRIRLGYSHDRGKSLDSSFSWSTVSMEDGEKSSGTTTIPVEVP